MTENNGNLNFIPSMAHYLTMGACYLGGLATYSLKCPERFKPGEFDILVSLFNNLCINFLLGS